MSSTNSLSRLRAVFLTVPVIIASVLLANYTHFNMSSSELTKVTVLGVSTSSLRPT